MLEIMRENASGWIVKILFAIIIVVFVFAFGMSGLDTGNDPVLATVNDQVITRAEFEDAFQRRAEAVRKANPNVTTSQLQSPQFKQFILTELVNSRLLLAEAARLGISASDEEVFAAITRQPIFWNKEGQFDRNIYQMALRSIRMTPTKFETSFKNENIANKVKKAVRQAGSATPEQTRSIFDWVNEKVTVDYIQSSPSDFLNSVKVSENQIQEFYDKNAKLFMRPELVSVRYLRFTPESLASAQEVAEEDIEKYYTAHADSMTQQEEVKARHILIKTEASDDEATQAKAKAKIEKIFKLAKSGQDFAKLAKKYSEGPSSVTGGDLGWFARGAMVPEFEKAAFETAKGSFSKPIKTIFGWHIIQVEDKKDAAAKSLDEMRSEIKKTLAEEKASGIVSDLLDQGMDRLVSGMKINDVAQELGLVAVTSQPMAEKQLPQAFGMTPEAAKVVMQIPEGEVHKTPLAVDDGYILLEKVKDMPAAPIELERVKESIIQKIKQDKATQLAKKSANDILAAITANPESISLYAKKITTSEPFTRQGIIPGLGQNQNLAQAAFAAKEKTWFKQTYTLASGIVVARLHERIPASSDLWEKQKSRWLEQASENYENEVLAAFMEELRHKATIEITRPDLLN